MNEHPSYAILKLAKLNLGFGNFIIITFPKYFYAIFGGSLIMINNVSALKTSLPPHPLDQCCNRCPLYPCELIPEYKSFISTHGNKYYIDDEFHITANSLSYDKPNLDPCIVRTDTDNITCGKKHIADGIGDHYQIELTFESNIRSNTTERWEPTQPVFISAQTGQGKNYFIENTLIPYVRELNHKNATRKKILIFSNRRALKEQLVSHTKSRTNYFYPDDYVDVMVYQNLLDQANRLEAIQNKANRRYAFVICDEAHFFSSDSMFNPYTHKILEKLVYLFRESVRIYMSATPYDCLEHIIRQEKTSEKYAPMVFYHFDRNYSYLDIKTYTDHDELIPIIQESVMKKKERWLVFIDNIEGGNRFANKLKTLNDTADKKMEQKVATLDSRKKQEPLFESLVLNEALDKETFVLITTSVLDNGINLNNIDHIVASSLDKVQVLQMVGRARKTAENQNKTLYLKRPDKAYVERRIANLEEQKEAYHKFNLAYGATKESRGSSTYDFQMEYYHGSQEKWTNAIHWFGISKKDCKLHWNEIAKSMLKPRIEQYKSILKEMLDENIPGQKYLEHQLSWFGKTYSRDNDITYRDKEKALKELISFLEGYAKNQTIINTKQELELFHYEFRRLFDTAFYKSEKNKRPYGAKKMNKLLTAENINFQIDGQANKGPWIVVPKTGTFSTASDSLTGTDTNPQNYEQKKTETRKFVESIAELVRQKGKRLKNQNQVSNHKRTSNKDKLRKNKPTTNTTTSPATQPLNQTTNKVSDDAAVGKNMSRKI